jgi:hypothetical protein
VAVTAAGGLCKGVESAFGAIDDGKADIDTGFDQLGGDENDRLALFAKPFGPGKDEHDVPRAHAGREVEGVGVGTELLVERLGGLGGIDDEETAVAPVLEDVRDELFVGERAQVFASDSFEGFEEGVSLTDDLGDFGGRDTDLKLLTPFECRLGGGAEDGGGVEVVDEAAEGTEDGVEQVGRESLDFVEDDDASCDAVELSAGAGAMGEEGFEEPDVGGDDERGVPVFGAEAIRFGFAGGVEFRVVFEDNIAPEFSREGSKNLTEDVGVLLDNTCERDDEDDAPMAILQGMAEGEEERREGLAATGGNGKGEKAGWALRSMKAVLADGFAGEINRVFAGGAEPMRHVGFKGVKHSIEQIVGPRQAEGCLVRLHEGFGGEEVGINEAGEKEA